MRERLLRFIAAVSYSVPGHVIKAAAWSAVHSDQPVGGIDRPFAEHIADQLLTNPAEASPPASDHRAIGAALERLENHMTKIADALGRLTAADLLLANEVDEMLADLDTLSGSVAAAVAAALAAAGLDDAAQASAIDAATASTQALVDKIKAKLPAAPPPPAAITVSPLSLSGTVGTPFSGAFIASGGAEPYSFAAGPSTPTDIVVAADGTYQATAGQSEAGNFELTGADANGVQFDVEIAYSVQ